MYKHKQSALYVFKCWAEEEIVLFVCTVSGTRVEDNQEKLILRRRNKQNQLICEDDNKKCRKWNKRQVKTCDGAAKC